jgi:hypothetical protein
MAIPGLDRNLDFVQSLGKKRVIISPRFQLNGVSAPTLLSDTIGAKLIRVSQGYFLLTLDTQVGDVLRLDAEMEFANPGVNPPIYNTGTTYTLGQTVVPTTAAKQTGYYYMITTASGSAASTEPTWGTVIGGTCTDGGGDTFTNMGPIPGNTTIVPGIPIGAPLATTQRLTGAPFVTSQVQLPINTVVVQNTYVLSATAGVTYLYLAIKNGTTAGTVTALGTTINGITVDNTVVWLCVGKLGQGNTNTGNGLTGVGAVVPICLYGLLWTSVGQLNGLIDSGPATPGTTVCDYNLLAFEIICKNTTINKG